MLLGLLLLGGLLTWVFLPHLRGTPGTDLALVVNANQLTRLDLSLVLQGHRDRRADATVTVTRNPGSCRAAPDAETTLEGSADTERGRATVYLRATQAQRDELAGPDGVNLQHLGGPVEGVLCATRVTLDGRVLPVPGDGWHFWVFN